MKLLKSKKFKNGEVFLLETDDGYPVEVTDTYLPYYTKDSVGRKQNKLNSSDCVGRSERWMIGISCMSGCPVGCKFCATGKLKKCRKLTAKEMYEQVKFIIERNRQDPCYSREFKVNYTRMGEPFLNIDAVRDCMDDVSTFISADTHHYISTIGVDGSDFSWIKGNVTLQVSLHSLDESRRSSLIPWEKKMSIEELGAIRTNSNLKTTLNLTLVDGEDWDVKELSRCFDPQEFFVKLSPINKNDISDRNLLGAGIIKSTNLV